MKLHCSLILGTAILAACTSPQKPPDEIFLPKLAQLSPGTDDVRLSALLLGKLVVDNGCVGLESAGQHMTVLWYDEIELDQSGPGHILKDTSSGKRYRIGEHVRLGGGEISSEYVLREYPEVARRCSEPYSYGYFAK